MRLIHAETLCEAGLLGESLPCLTEDPARAAYRLHPNRRGARKVRRRLRELRQSWLVMLFTGRCKAVPFDSGLMLTRQAFITALVVAGGAAR